MKEENITVIAGGSGGIGRSVVRKFLRKGDRVIVVDINKITDENITSDEKYSFLKADITNPDDIMIAKKKIEKKFKKIDNLISMAGINMKSEIGGLETITIEDIDKSIKLNLNSHIYLIKIFLGLLEKEDAVKNIVMISSINAISNYGLPAYSGAKAGLYGFMKAVTNELGNQGIRINTISLGTVPHSTDVIEGNEYFESKKSKLPLKEFVRPTDVADAIYSLVYRMKAIVGQNIVLDMGQSL
ncbi:MAG: SDR family oxidoreductase [Clostridia bacterium]|nr:SDR family oxidoreductase [Clostridia bacterium]